MPPRKTATAPAAPRSKAAGSVPAKKANGALIRSVGPAIPLAIALAHTALAPTPKVSAPPAQEMTMSSGAPVPMLAKGHPVNWWFVFKLNASAFPQCGGGDVRACPFGGTPGAYKNYGQQYVYASSDQDTLQQGGKECLGDGTDDPVGASFDEVYNGKFHYVVWNDQTYQDPKINGCSGDGCEGPWGHSKGMVAWDDDGDGFVMQVSTPSWPASGSAVFPRKTDGNSLGCVKDNDVGVSQHFFALKLNHADLLQVLQGLGNASVVTDPNNPQIVNNGGPADVMGIVTTLGKKSASTTVVSGMLSSGVELISKPSDLNVPPWQMVSSVMGGVSLRTATWWATPEIYSTTAGVKPGCWSSTLSEAPGAVEIAKSGTWNNVKFSLEASPGTNGNHAKIGVSTSGTDHYAIFGDENQQGALAASAKQQCSSSQNGRGGMFFVMKDAGLAASVAGLIAGDSEPVQ